MSRFDFVVADQGSERRLILRDPQHEHVFNEAGPRKAPRPAEDERLEDVKERNVTRSKQRRSKKH